MSHTPEMAKIMINPRKSTFINVLPSLFVIAMVAVLFPYHATADDATIFNPRTGPQSDRYFEDISFNLISGVLFSPTFIAARTHVLDYSPINVRLRWMLHSPFRSQSLLKGNIEAILSFSNSVIYKGTGHSMQGITGLIRYNFLEPGSRIIPYFQGGAGIIYTDVYKDFSRTPIVQATEITPQASLGLRYRINSNWSIDTEAMFHYVSKTDLWEYDTGINSFGGFIGLTYLYNSRLFKGPSFSMKGKALSGQRPIQAEATEKNNKKEKGLHYKGSSVLVGSLKNRPRHLGITQASQKDGEGAIGLIESRSSGRKNWFTNDSKGKAKRSGLYGLPIVIAKRSEKWSYESHPWGKPPSTGSQKTHGHTSLRENRTPRILRGIRSKTSGGEFCIVILTDDPVLSFKDFFLFRPSRLVIDLEGKWRKPEYSLLSVKSDIVKGIRVGKHPNKLRLVMDLIGKEIMPPIIHQSPEGLIIAIRRGTRIKISPVLVVVNGTEDLMF